MSATVHPIFRDGKVPRRKKKGEQERDSDSDQSSTSPTSRTGSHGSPHPSEEGSYHHHHSPEGYYHRWVKGRPLDLSPVNSLEMLAVVNHWISMITPQCLYL